MAKIKKGDQVQVIAGRDKGKTGRVLEVLTESDRIIVEGVQRVKRHTKVGQSQRGARTGGIETIEAPIHVSNVQLVVGSGKDAQVTRVGYERREVTKRRPDGTEYTAQRSFRIARKTGKEI